MSKDAKSQETGLQVYGVQDVPKMLETVKDQIKNLKGNVGKEEPTAKPLPGFGMIKDIKKLSDLIKAASMVNAKSAAYKEAAKQIVPEGIKPPNFEIEGMSQNSIIDHLRKRYAELYNSDRIKELLKVQKILEENLSAEAKLANSLKDIAGILKS